MSIAPLGGATQAGAVGAAKAAPTKADEAGEGFERMLLGQLTEQLAKSVQRDEETESAATATYRDMLPDALADALVAGGGLGLAKSLTPKDVR